jgi:hypothetical protein
MFDGQPGPARRRQQRLVALGLGLQTRASVPGELHPLRRQVGLVTIVVAVSAEVQEISREYGDPVEG